MATLNSRLLIVLEARDKVASKMHELSPSARTAINRLVRAALRLTKLTMILRERGSLVAEGMPGVRQAMEAVWETLRNRRAWVIIAGTLAIALGGTRGAMRLMVNSGETLDPEKAPSPSEGLIPLAPFMPSGTDSPVVDFLGAYVLEVTHLSTDSSMIGISFPVELEGDYRAVVTMAEEQDFQCVILAYYPHRLYCAGPLLEEGKLARIRVFRIDEGQALQRLVFETQYYIGEAPRPVNVTAAVPVPYGGGFTGPDRFNDIERERERASSVLLWPLSIVLAISAVGCWMSAWLNLGQASGLSRQGEPRPIH